MSRRWTTGYLFSVSEHYWKKYHPPTTGLHGTAKDTPNTTKVLARCNGPTTHTYTHTPIHTQRLHTQPHCNPHQIQHDHTPTTQPNP